MSGQAVDEIEARADFLIRELNYNAQVQETLRGIKNVNRTLDEVEQARDERRILDALHLLESERCARWLDWAPLIVTRIVEATGYCGNEVVSRHQASRCQSVRAQVGRA